MFQGSNLQSRFRIFLTGCKLFATIKILIILLVTDLTSSTKNFSNSIFSTKISNLTKMTYSNSIFITKISHLTENG